MLIIFCSSNTNLLPVVVVVVVRLTDAGGGGEPITSSFPKKIQFSPFPRSLTGWRFQTFPPFRAFLNLCGFGETCGHKDELIKNFTRFSETGLKRRP